MGPVRQTPRADATQSSELLKKIEEFNRSIEESGREEPQQQTGQEEMTPNQLLEMKAAGPGTGVKAEGHLPMPTWESRATPSPIPGASERGKPKPSSGGHPAPASLEQLAQEMELKSWDNSQLSRVLAALYLAMGREDKAFMAASRGQAGEEDWEKLIDAAASFQVGETDSALALVRQVLRDWQTQSPLKITKLAFCERITAYGVYEEYKREWMAPGQMVVLYCEVANFSSERALDGTFTTKLSLQIEVRDGNKPLWTWKPPAVVDRSRNERTDFYIATRFYLPQDLSAGKYTLHVTLRDEIGNKTAEDQLPLTMKPL